MPAYTWNFPLSIEIPGEIKHRYFLARFGLKNALVWLLFISLTPALSPRRGSQIGVGISLGSQLVAHS
jgi:hypothetical protein